MKNIVSTLVLAFMLGIATPVLSTINASPVSALSISEPTTSYLTHSISTYADSSDIDVTADFVSVATEAELKAQLRRTDGETVRVRLTEDIEITGTASIYLPEAVVIDLGGHNITSTIDSDIFNIWGANVTFTGNGTISASGAKTYSVIGIYEGDPYGHGANHVTIDRGVTITSGGNKYAIGIVEQSQNSTPHHSTLEVRGQLRGGAGISINGTIDEADKSPAITLTNSSVIESSTVAIYAAGIGDWTIDAATITAATPIAAKSGSFTITDATITATGSYGESHPGLNGNGIDATGVVFQVEHNQDYAGNITFAIDGGTYTSRNGAVFYEYSDAASQSEAAAIDISGGSFSAASDQAIFAGDGTTTQSDISITGGTFKGTDVKDFYDNGYLAPGAVVGSDGSVVTPSRTSSSSRTQTYTSADGRVSVTGQFSRRVTVDATVSDRIVSLFGDRHYVMYDIALTDASGRPVTLTSPVTVSIQLPATLSGTRSSIYYVHSDLDSAERLGSSYVNGVITFTTDHFSYYAIVEDNGIPIPGTTEAQTSSTPSGSQTAPDTGTLADRGIVSAVATILPFVMLGGLAVFVYSRVMIRRRRAEIRADLELEAQQIISEPTHSAPETPLDNFVATPLTSSDAEEIRSHIFDRHCDE